MEGVQSLNPHVVVVLILHENRHYPVHTRNLLSTPIQLKFRETGFQDGHGHSI